MSSLLSASHRVLLGLIGAALPLAAAVAEPEGKARTAYDFAPSDARARFPGAAPVAASDRFKPKPAPEAAGAEADGAVDPQREILTPPVADPSPVELPRPDRLKPNASPAAPVDRGALRPDEPVQPSVATEPRPAPKLRTGTGSKSERLPIKSAPVAESTAETAPASEPTPAPLKPRAAEVAKPERFLLQRSAGALAAERERATIKDKQLDDIVPDEHKLVKPLLAAHPDSNVIICMAGCGDKPTIVQVIPRKVSKIETRSEMIPTSGPSSDFDEPVENVPPTGDIICIAGCLGKPGEIVHKNVRLTWMSKEKTQHLTHALQAIADRLLKVSDAQPRASRGWMSLAARSYLTGGNLTAAARD